MKAVSLCVQQEPPTKKTVDYSLLRRLLVFLKPYRLHLVGAILLTLSASALGPLRPFLTRIAVDDHIIKGDLSGLLMFTGLILGLLFLQGLLQYALSLLMTWIGQRVLLDIRNTLFRHAEGLALRYYDTTPVGRAAALNPDGTLE
jgi:ATP-binding cassette subfamily B protein